MADTRVEAVRTGDLNNPVTLLACTRCGVIVWDIDAHYGHAHPAPTTEPQSDSVGPEEALTAHCNTCGAEPGASCITTHPFPGREMRYPHPARYQRAREARPGWPESHPAGR